MKSNKPLRRENHENEKLNPDACRPVYTLGIASQLSEIPAHSIRQYIDRGLLIPFNLSSRRHLFSQNDIGRLKQIHLLIHEKGLNIAGIRALMAMLPYWAMHQCSEKDRQTCDAYTANMAPCWETSNKGRNSKNENCRECDVYKSLCNEDNLKSVLYALIPE